MSVRNVNFKSVPEPVKCVAVSEWESGEVAAALWGRLRRREKIEKLAPLEYEAFKRLIKKFMKVESEFKDVFKVA